MAISLPTAPCIVAKISSDIHLISNDFTVYYSNWTLAEEVDRTNAIISRQGSRTRSSPLMKATTIPISVLPLSTIIPPSAD
jgi:hypothetical protein